MPRNGQSRVDISGLDKAAVLAALYNGSAPIGLSFSVYRPGSLDIEAMRRKMKSRKAEIGRVEEANSPDLKNPPSLKEEWVRRIGKGEYSFDLMNGRPLHISVAEDSFNPDEYDKRFGKGAAQRIIDILRITGQEAASAIEEIHSSHLVAEAKKLIATPPGKYTGNARHMYSVEKRARGVAIEVLHQHELALPTLSDLALGLERPTHNQ